MKKLLTIAILAAAAVAVPLVVAQNAGQPAPQLEGGFGSGQGKPRQGHCRGF